MTRPAQTIETTGSSGNFDVRRQDWPRQATRGWGVPEPHCRERRKAGRVEDEAWQGWGKGEYCALFYETT